MKVLRKIRNNQAKRKWSFWPLIWLLSQIFGRGSQKQAKNGQKGQKLAVNAANECTFEIDLLLGLVV